MQKEIILSELDSSYAPPKFRCPRATSAPNGLRGFRGKQLNGEDPLAELSFNLIPEGSCYEVA